MTRTADALHLAGTQLTEDTAHAALREAGLAGWDVRKQTLRTSGNLKVHDRWGIVRNDPQNDYRPTYMNSCGSRYQIVQNEEHADILDLLVGETQGKYENAQAFRGGRVVYLSIKLPDHLLVGGTDRVDLYINAINSFDGTTNFVLSLDPVRAVCLNQLNHFNAQYKMKHSGNTTAKIQQAREALGLMFTGTERFEREANALYEREITDSQFDQIVSRLFPRPAKRQSAAYDELRDKITGIYQGYNTDNIRGTSWGGFQTVVEYLDWERPIRGKETPVKRAERILLDARAKELKREAYGRFAEAGWARSTL